MDRLAGEIEATRELVEPRWDDARAARVYAATLRLRRRRQIVHSVAVGSALSAAAAVLLMFTAFDRNTVAVAVAPSSSVEDVEAQTSRQTIGTVRTDHKLRFADGSTTRLAGERSELDILENDPNSVALRLRSGLATFEVVPNKERRFVVSAGEVDVIVVGTAFEVERRGDGVRVAVQRGRVRVVGPDGVRYMEAGQSRLFSGGSGSGDAVTEESPAANVASVASTSELPGTHRRRLRQRGATRGARQSHGWRHMVEAGSHERAYEALARGAKVGDDPGALLDAADAARFSGYPVAAVKYLQRVVDRHAASPVAPLAAFTLGRVLLDRLGQPHRAAAAFQDAWELSPSGSMAQDALARQVEALSKGGDVQGAYRLARRYVSLYPSGRRVRSVRLYGGL